jgi:drug/metabolite transporter (DMT)-like permease
VIGTPVSPSHIPAQQPLRGIALISVAVLLFSLTDAISKYMTQHYPVGFILWIRFLLHTLVILAVVGARRGLGFMITRRPGIQIVRGLMLPVAALMFVSGTRLMPLAETAAITFVSPLVVTLLAVLILHERVGVVQWLAIICSFIGVLLIIRPGGALFDWPALLPMGTAFAMAVYQVLTRRVAGLESAYTSIFYPGLIGLILFSLMLPFTWTEPLAWWHVALMTVTGVVGATSHLILIKAFEHAPASLLAPFSYTQLIWTALVGWIVFGDFPDTLAVMGMAVITASGVLIASRVRSR